MVVNGGGGGRDISWTLSSVVFFFVLFFGAFFSSPPPRPPFVCFLGCLSIYLTVDRHLPNRSLSLSLTLNSHFQRSLVVMANIYFHIGMWKQIYHLNSIRIWVFKLQSPCKLALYTFTFRVQSPFFCMSYGLWRCKVLGELIMNTVPSSCQHYMPIWWRRLVFVHRKGSNGTTTGTCMQVAARTLDHKKDIIFPCIQDGQARYVFDTCCSSLLHR